MKLTNKERELFWWNLAFELCLIIGAISITNYFKDNLSLWAGIPLIVLAILIRLRKLNS